MRRAPALVLIALLALASPRAGTAQAAWDAPMLLAPGAPAGLGIHLIDPGAGGGIGVLGTWRSNPAPVGLGFRVGIVEASDDDIALTAGVDISGALARFDGEVPVDLMWFTGAGVGIGEVTFSVPLGISAGVAFRGDQVTFRPYLAPRMILDAYLESDTRPDSDIDLGVAVEVGLDLQFSQPWAVRASGSFGDRDAVSIGVVLPVGTVRD